MDDVRRMVSAAEGLDDSALCRLLHLLRDMAERRGLRRKAGRHRLPDDRAIELMRAMLEKGEADSITLAARVAGERCGCMGNSPLAMEKRLVAKFSRRFGNRKKIV